MSPSPSYQGSLYDAADATTAEAEADTGIERSVAKMGRLAPAWGDRFSRAALNIASKGPFITEQVLAVVGPPPAGVDPRCVGSLMRKLRDVGKIRPTGRFVNGTAVSRHGAPVREWEAVP